MTDDRKVGVSEPPAAHASEHDGFSFMRHELCTPVNAIVGYTEMLLEDAQDQGQDNFVPDLNRIHTAGKTLLMLINTLVVAPSDEIGESAPSPLELEYDVGVVDSVEVEVQSAHFSKGRILVVDDNEDNRDMLGRRLQKQGHTISMAANGREALDMLSAGDFDLVLLDIMMPEMDGYQVLKELKSDPARNYIPVIMLSALSELDSVVRCIEMGAEDYLPKPFNPVLLRARIGACLEKKRLRDQEIDYLRNVGLVTHAATTVEAGTFSLEGLAPVATRDDELGQLARVFQKMGREVQTRELQLKQQVRQLRIEIDHATKERQVAEITETDYFQQLQQKAQDLRRRKG